MRIKQPVIMGAIAAILLFSACSNRPDEVLSPEDMAQLLADMHVGESVVENNYRHYNSDSARNVLLQSIYAKHGVTSAQVDSSMMWYGRNMDKYIEVYDRVMEILDGRIAQAQDVAGASSVDISGQSFAFEGDSVDVWPDIRYRRLGANMPNNFISFSLPSDRNWEKGDAYELKLKLISAQGRAKALIMAEYHDGKREYITSSMNGEGWNSVKFVSDSARMPYNVSGFIYYEPVGKEVAYVDSISLARTRWGAHQREPRGQVRISSVNKWTR